MVRAQQVMLIVSVVLLSWYGMMAVHELGHVVAALATGGRVDRVMLPMVGFSQTVITGQPNMLVTVWAGAVVGVLVPLMVYGVWRALRWPCDYIWRFFCGVCLLVNGAYLAFGTFNGAGDVGDLLFYGAAKWQLWLFGAITMPVGVWMWHGIGSHFGLGAARGRVQPLAAYICTGLLALLFIALLIVSPG